MRNQKERFAVFPFSAICISQSSVEVIDNHPKKSQAISNPTQTNEGEIQSKRRTKSSFLPLREAFRTFKGLSHVFQFYKEEHDDDDDEDEEGEMVIGLPTDVRHVAHIGWDGFNSWDKGQELALPTMSLKQFELAMAAT